MKVHEAAKLLGVTPRSLRFYEEKGLIKPHKEAVNGYRTYSDDDLLRLRWIVTLRELGMPVSAIIEALNSMDEPEAFICKIDGARASLYEEWVSATEALQALDETLLAWQQGGSAQLVHAEQTAERIRQNRKLRSSWSDQWNYNEIALRYGQDAPQATLEGELTAQQYEQALGRTVEWLDPRPGEPGLELGAGSGNLSVLLAAAGVKLTVIEQSTEMLSILRNRLPLVDAKQGNLLTLPLTSQSYSFIGCTFAMHHLNHSQQLLALEEMDRVLMPGGRIVITGLMSEQEPEQSVKHELPLVTTSSLPELVHSLEDNGYSVVTESLWGNTCILCAIKP
ncbi:MerR family transcriptional regulator [Paenibacillus prosopidis]|uniref:DNA-binding transcriptional MerR regulator n=1 Tax=Paenibacillus prosopidis TaxID=630520 RepID=A0A368W9D8_9BACL|nr:MerR family transcriptional regulator [Paenibacillus prosopidis]RCW51061.1 DNA-binding transcriptional MerR regulator [Paenibacillus prosopidis]